MKIAVLLAVLSLVQTASVKATQLTYPRVATAYGEKEAIVKGYFREKGLDYHSFNLFIRILKKEQKVEAWIRSKGKSQYELLHTYDFCSTSGHPGPKRKEGDGQIPEGIYRINHFNPVSNFYLSLGINYPNESDKILSHKEHPGSAIYIHGNCVTIGCIPITDDKIKELYVMAVEAKNGGQTTLPVHIFPGYLDASQFETLQADAAGNDSLHAFWSNLKTIYDDFESSKTIRSVKVSSKGLYYF